MCSLIFPFTAEFFHVIVTKILVLPRGNTRTNTATHFHTTALPITKSRSFYFAFQPFDDLQPSRLSTTLIQTNHTFSIALFCSPHSAPFSFHVLYQQHFCGRESWSYCLSFFYLSFSGCDSLANSMTFFYSLCSNYSFEERSTSRRQKLSTSFSSRTNPSDFSY